MKFEMYKDVDGKKLRCGYTTGTCATIASTASTYMILNQKIISSCKTITPSNVEVETEVFDAKFSNNFAKCSVIKDGGDDPDITNGSKIFSEVKLTTDGKITILGGEGVGKVTKAGLDQPIGEYAINSTPRRTITENVRKILSNFGAHYGAIVTISIPKGKLLSKKTFNPKLGIIGGISVLGTSGIVEPMSDSALIATIKTELNQQKAIGYKYTLLTPGNYGKNFLYRNYNLTKDISVKTSNFIGEALNFANEFKFKGTLLVGHIGKLSKVYSGVFNTHSKYGDKRANAFITEAKKLNVSNKIIEKIENAVMTDEMIDIIDEAGVLNEVMQGITQGIENQIKKRYKNFNFGVIIFSNKRGVVGETALAEEIFNKIIMERK